MKKIVRKRKKECNNYAVRYIRILNDTEQDSQVKKIFSTVFFLFNYKN